MSNITKLPDDLLLQREKTLKARIKLAEKDLRDVHDEMADRAARKFRELSEGMKGQALRGVHSGYGRD